MSNDRIPCPEFDLSGKVAVVTGAGRGMGRYMALDLARFGADLGASTGRPPGPRTTKSSRPTARRCGR